MATTVDAEKQPHDRDRALALARQVKRIITARGKKVVTLALDPKAPPPEEELLAALLGPTGKLRAPTIRVGDTLLVGFNAAAYRELLGR